MTPTSHPSEASAEKVVAVLVSLLALLVGFGFWSGMVKKASAEHDAGISNREFKNPVQFESQHKQEEKRKGKESIQGRKRNNI